MHWQGSPTLEESGNYDRNEIGVKYLKHLCKYCQLADFSILHYDKQGKEV